MGILRIIMGFQMKGKKGWGWLVFAGLVSLLLGGIILFEWPATGLWVIGLLVAIELIIHGWSYVFVALAARRTVKEPAPDRYRKRHLTGSLRLLDQPAFFHFRHDDIGRLTDDLLRRGWVETLGIFRPRPSFHGSSANFVGKFGWNRRISEPGIFAPSSLDP
jgi:hypothetical protein